MKCQLITCRPDQLVLISQLPEGTTFLDMSTTHPPWIMRPEVLASKLLYIKVGGIYAAETTLGKALDTEDIEAYISRVWAVLKDLTDDRD